MKRKHSNIFGFHRNQQIYTKAKPPRKHLGWLCFVIIFLLSGNLFAARVDTISIYSAAMHKSFKCVVIRPDSYNLSKGKKLASYPVVYLLHGWAGAYNNWVMKVPEIKSYVDSYQLIIVCPDGGFAGWYLDSPVDSSFRYESYIAKEVPAFIDSHYRTIKDRKARAITGLSMGGQGALRLAFWHANFFGACGSMSGVVDLNKVHTKYDIVKRLGDTLSHIDNWNRYSVMNVVSNYPKDSLAIIIDCGIGDVFYKENHFLHDKLLQLNIPHDYTERPGFHDWAYWKNAVKYQLMFFRDYFAKK